MAGKDFSPSNQDSNALTLTQNKQLTGLINDVRGELAKHTSATAFETGIPLQKALRADRANVKILLLAELERLVRQVGAQRTFQDQADLQNAIEDVIEVFPSLKLEEILLAFKAIRQGRFQLYGTFNTLTLIDCIRKYEMENTVPLRERAHKQTQNDVETTCIDWARLARDLQLDGKLQRPKKTLDRYIPLPNNLESFDEIEDWRAKHIKTEEKDEET